MSDEHQIDREDCYICGRGNPDVLERHHIVPRRHGGSDESVNLVDVCPTCHRALETLYSERFYRALGVGDHDEIIQYAAGDIADQIEQLELYVSTELRKYHDRIQNEYVTEVDEEEIRKAMWEYVEENGESDLDSSDVTEQNDIVCEIIKECEEKHSDSEMGAPIDCVINKAVEAGIGQDDAENSIKYLRDHGEVYQTQTDYLRVVV